VGVCMGFGGDEFFFFFRLQQQKKMTMITAIRSISYGGSYRDRRTNWQMDGRTDSEITSFKTMFRACMGELAFNQ
jgi:hypothetical protein